MAPRDTQDGNGGVEQWVFETEDSILLSPTVVDGTVYVVSKDNGLYAVDTATGTQEWAFETRPGTRSALTVVDGTVYVKAEHSTLYAVDATTGTQEWASESAPTDNGSMTVVDGTVYLGCTNGVLDAVNAATGTREWVFKTGDSIRTSPTVVDGTVYVVSYDNNLYAVDSATGTQEWAFETGSSIESSPTVVDDTVYVGSRDNSLYAVNATDGTKQWAFETGWVIASSPTVVDGTVFVGSEDNSLYAVDAATGTQEWAFETGSSIESSPTVMDDMVYIGSCDNNLYAVNAATGTREWVFKTGDSIPMSPTVAGGTVYVGNYDNNLYAVDSATGTQEWAFETGSSIESSPTVMNDMVYVGSCDNNLYAVTTAVAQERSQEGEQSERSLSTRNLTPPEDSLQPDLAEIETGTEQIPSRESVRSPDRCILSPEDFQTIEAIGEGGQAVIKKARLTDSKAPPEVVAIRQVPTSSTVAREAIEQFQTRSEIWETIDARERNKRRWRDSEHIVGVIDTGDEPFPWIAMEYIDGGDLAELLEEHPDGLHVRQALWIGECVCKGLEIAHKLGKCHLDVKPENVLLKQTDGWPWPKLADWGLARNLAKETGTVSALSPEYAAPEQLDSGKLADPDQLTDIYQTGTVVYALLTGDPPMSEGSIEPPSEQRSKLSAEVDAVVELALAQEKTDRYDSIADFRKALNAIRIGERLPREVARRVGE